MKTLSSSDILELTSVGDLVDPLERAMIAVSDGRQVYPPRQAPEVFGPGRMGVMFGAIDDPPVHGAKILSLFPNAPEQGLSSHQGMVLLFDSTDGRPLAALDADTLTAIRTATATMLATKALARPLPTTVTILSAGEQAEWHARGFLEVFPSIRTVRIWARRPEKAAELIERLAANGCDADKFEAVSDLGQAIRGSDVIAAVSASRTAFLPGELLEPGQHVNLVGSSQAMVREIDDVGVARLTMFTDSLESSALESGEIIEARAAGVINDDYHLVEIGSVLSGDATGRSSDDQITGYKSHGVIAQDLAAAAHILSKLPVPSTINVSNPAG